MTGIRGASPAKPGDFTGLVADRKRDEQKREDAIIKIMLDEGVSRAGAEVLYDARRNSIIVHNSDGSITYEEVTEDE